jgi:asparagine synthase (glutamine-hydrolysing)
MCGLTGFYTPGGTDPVAASALVTAMAATLTHRGPDDAGCWVDGGAGIALAHRRLSILDLSPAGHQPMVSPSGRYMVVFNGEIYNHLDLRMALGDRVWRGHSDTETLVAAIEAWGLPEALRRCVGMFALALWDCERRELSLARDRMGEKPLYCGWQGDSFLFASELKAIERHPGFVRHVDRNALAAYLRFGYIPAPHTIYEGLFKLRPGCVLSVDRNSDRRGQLGYEPYWSLSEVVARYRTEDRIRDEAEAIRGLDARLRMAICGQRIADVPVGAFLSGGIDSSTVVAIQQATSMLPVRTFTIGFHEQNFNEADHAKAVARHLHTEHTELYVTPREAMDLIPRLPAMFDEPFGDSSQIPTFLVAQLARTQVTVALSGDGGDELFGGYTRYQSAARTWNRVSRLPRGLRTLLGGVLQVAADTGLASLLGPAVAAARGRPTSVPFGERLGELAGWLSSPTGIAMYRLLVSHWPDPPGLVPGAVEAATIFDDPESWNWPGSLEEEMMYADGCTYLPDDILAKVDRTAMANSLETRVPMLDHRLVEFAWSLDGRLRANAGDPKRLLKQVLYQYVPKELIERPKMGFGVPVGEWLRGPLRDWAEDLLDERRMANEGFLALGPIRRRWQEHLSGKYDWRDPLWQVLMFQAFLRRIA